MMPPRIKRKVLGSEFQQASHARPGHGSKISLLDCGHEIRTKSSEAVPEYKFCTACESLRRGSVQVIGRVLERWDANLSQPLKIEYSSEKAALAAMRKLFHTPKEQRA